MKRLVLGLLWVGFAGCGEDTNDVECSAIVICCAYTCMSQAEIDVLEPDNCDCQMDPPPPSEQCLNVEGECVFVE